MKRIIFFALALVTSLSVTMAAGKGQNRIYNTPSHQQNSGDGHQGLSFDAAIGGGWSQLSYQFDQGKNPGSWGMNAHLGINYFFTDHIGLGIGAEVAHYGSNALFRGDRAWQDVTDTDGERYTHYTTTDRWREQQDAWYVNFPLALQLVWPVGLVFLSAQVGAKFNLRVADSFRSHGTLEHYGYYDMWGLTIRDVPNHGFYTSTDLQTEGGLALRHTGSVFAKLGVLVPLAAGLDLTAHLYFDHAFLNVLPAGERTDLGWRNDGANVEMQAAHYFMQPYSSVLWTKSASDNAFLRSAGLEIGVRYTIQSKKNYPCHCTNDQFVPFEW